MAQHSISLLLTLASLAVLSSSKETKMIVYLQDYAAGPNTTAIAIAGIAGKLWTFTQIGTVYVTDDLITKTSDPNSALLGRSQGTYVVSSVDGRNLHISLSLVFSGEVYGESTLEIQGAYKHFERSSEVSIIGGTGKFRLARGYVTYETYSIDALKSHATLRLNITVLQLHCT